MKNDISAIEGRRHTIVALRERIAQVKTNAVTAEWPYTHVQPRVRIFATRMAALAETLLFTAAHELLFLSEESLGLAVDDTHVARVFVRFQAAARESGIAPEEVAEAIGAFVDAAVSQAQSLIIRAEACLEGEQTLDGTEIRHGALWYK